ncbi:hypothetical protein HELRODRAFT_179839 [Helobdella robusta]|uniref:WSC domain-containing protein n=1 Tax=Helobdella robusta TaxID=6412 RepID=T1FF72_HELRO|nr:hypothetical protein HELRODRAFT_179839 [Helobdella robusta]ESN94995.1 hypothetical protein HELRODRAFT_179839 [Helobdella robusta]
MTAFSCISFLILLLFIHLHLFPGTDAAGETYIGCYGFIVHTDATVVRNVKSYQHCKDFCMEKTLAYIALHNGNECYCVERAKYPIASSQCSMKCPDRKHQCGSRLYYSLYAIKTLKDFEHSLIDIFSLLPVKSTKIEAKDFLTTEICLTMCLELKTDIAQITSKVRFKPFENNSRYSEDECLNFLVGIVWLTQWHLMQYDSYRVHSDLEFYFSRLVRHDSFERDAFECYCSLRVDQVPDSKNGFFNESEPQIEIQTGSFVISHCSSGDVLSPNFRCSGGCKTGWTGGSCNVRECSKSNGDCGVGLDCKETTVNGVKYSECVCNQGQYRNKLWTCEVDRIKGMRVRLNKTLDSVTEKMLDSLEPCGVLPKIEGHYFEDDVSGGVAQTNDTLLKVLIVAVSFLLFLLLSIGSTVAFVRMKHPEFYEHKVQQVKNLKAKVGSKLSKSPKVSLKEEAEPKESREEKVAKSKDDKKAGVAKNVKAQGGKTDAQVKVAKVAPPPAKVAKATAASAKVAKATSKASAAAPAAAVPPAKSVAEESDDEDDDDDDDD